MKNESNAKQNKDINKVSNSTKQRLPYYLRTLRDLLEDDKNRICSTELAKLMNITASQIRQDLSSLGLYGLKGYGYDVNTLYTSILDIAGVREQFSAVIIGTKEMVYMLKSRPVFLKQGIALKKVFVTDDPVCLNDFENYCKNNKTDIIVLATEQQYTNKTVEIIKSLNIKGVCNFSDIKLDLDIPVKNIWIDDSLMTLCYEISHFN